MKVASDMHCSKFKTRLITFLLVGSVSNKCRMYSSKAFFLLIFVVFIHKSCTLRVEINVGTKGKQVKLTCVPDKLKDTKNNVLWEGVKLGIHDLHGLAMRNIPIPNIRVNSNRLKCYLENSESDPSLKKSRIGREVAGTVQTENGNCPPGYRIDQDRCYPCSPGSFTSGQETECFLCPRNFYMSKEAADSCWPCPEGTGTRNEGATSEDACQDFSYSDLKGGAGHDYKWYIIGILMIIFIIISWMIIAYLLIRYYYFERGKVIEAEDGDFQMKSTTTDDRFLAKHITHEHFLDPNENPYNRYDTNDSPTKRKLLKFDVDIKGSAVFTEQGSAETDVTDGEDKGFKRPRKDTISLISDSKSSKIGDSLSPELQSSDIKTTLPELEKNRAYVQIDKNSNNHSNNSFGNNKVSAELENNEVPRDNFVTEPVSENDNSFDSEKSGKLQDSSNIQVYSFDNENLNLVPEPKHSTRNSDDMKNINSSQNSESFNMVNDFEPDSRTIEINDGNKIIDDSKNENQFSSSKQIDLRKTEDNTNESYENFNQVSDMINNRETFENEGKNKMIDNHGHLNQVYNAKLCSSDETSSYTADTPEENLNSETEKSSTQEKSSNSRTSKSSSQAETSKHNVKALDNGISARNLLTAKKNSVFDNEGKSRQSENGELKQNSLYYPSYKNGVQKVEQTFSRPTFRKIQGSSYKNSITRFSEDHVQSDKSLNSRLRRSSTNSSSPDATSISKKWLNKNQKMFPMKPNEKPNEFRITIEPDEEKADKVLKRNTDSSIPNYLDSNSSGIPQLISLSQSRSVTEPTSCSIHQDFNSSGSPCHVEVVMLHQSRCHTPYFNASPNL